MDHGKYPYLLLLALRMMLFLTSPSAENQLLQLCVQEDELNDSIRVG